MRQNEPLGKEIFSEIEYELENIDRLREELKRALRENSSMNFAFGGRIKNGGS